MTYTSTRFFARCLPALVLPALAFGACAESSPSSPSTTPSAGVAVVESDTRHESKTDKRIAVIDAFLAAPITTATAPIIFMLKDSDATVAINNEVVPVLGLRTQKSGGILLTAFIAGNMREQLIRGTNADAPLSGVRAMLKVYAILKAEAEIDAVPSFEIMQQREMDGTLEQSLNAD